MIEIPHSRPRFGQPFMDAAARVIESGFLAQGEETARLEQQISRQLELRHVLAVDSGTSALMLAIRFLIRRKPAARVGIPAYACASLLFAVKAAGAQPVLMECDPYLCLDLAKALETARTLDVLVLVHPFGLVEPLAAQSFPCPVIEDIAQSVGASCDDKPVGTFADFSVGSLYATKPWGGAYGGFISGRSASAMQQLRQMCDPDNADLHADYAGHHQLSNLHAAMAAQRIPRADEEQKQRRRLAAEYDEVIQGAKAVPIHSQPGTSANHFRYIIRCEQPADIIIGRFQSLGIAASRPVPHVRRDGCPYTLDLWQHCVSLPMIADMSEAELNHMQHSIAQCLSY